jgi:hypothetical protein
MKILFDQGTPVPLRVELAGHNVSTTYELGWASLSNGELLRAAEADLELLITTDQNLRYQQNLAGRNLSILVLPTTSWPGIQQHSSEVVAAVAAIRPGEFRQIQFS